MDIIVTAGLILTEACYGSAKKAGWHTDAETGMPHTPDQNHEMFPAKIAFAHGHLSEALKAHTLGMADPNLPLRLAAPVALADAVIAIFDLAGALHYDLGIIIAEKLAYNRRRENRWIENLRIAAAEGTI